MEAWQYSEDRMLANPPEPKKTKCFCSVCKDPLYFDEEYYELDGEIYCELCAEKWLKAQRNWVSEWMAYGEE